MKVETEVERAVQEEMKKRKAIQRKKFSSKASKEKGTDKDLIRDIRVEAQATDMPDERSLPVQSMLTRTKRGTKTMTR